MKKRAGVILVTVLWVVAFLALFAFGLGRLSSGGISLLRASVGKLQAQAAARSGVIYVEDLLLRRPSSEDVLGRVGVRFQPSDKQQELGRVTLASEAYFDLNYFSSTPTKDGQKLVIQGIEDEAGRLNLNSIVSVTDPGALVLKNVAQRVVPGSGDQLVQAIVRLRQGAENDAGPRQINFPEELLARPEITPELFKKIRPFITTHSTGYDLANCYTASEPVVRAIFDELSLHSSDGLRDAENFLTCRMTLKNFDSSVGRCPLQSYILGYEKGTMRSGVYRIRSVGVYPAFKSRAVIETVVRVEGEGVQRLSWHRE